MVGDGSTGERNPRAGNPAAPVLSDRLLTILHTLLIVEGQATAIIMR